MSKYSYFQDIDEKYNSKNFTKELDSVFYRSEEASHLHRYPLGSGTNPGSTSVLFSDNKTCDFSFNFPSEDLRRVAIHSSSKSPLNSSDSSFKMSHTIPVDSRYDHPVTLRNDVSIQCFREAYLEGIVSDKIKEVLPIIKNEDTRQRNIQIQNKLTIS